MLTTFPNLREFHAAKAFFEAAKVPHSTLDPSPGYARVGIPAVVVAEADHHWLLNQERLPFICSGWVMDAPTPLSIPAEEPVSYSEDILGKLSIMTMQQCIADSARIRCTAHLSGNLKEVLPYLNASVPNAGYNPAGPSLTFADQNRIITLYPDRISLGKINDIIDAWRVLEMVRVQANECWQKRGAIKPCEEYRNKPTALAIFAGLPKTNCGKCGEKTCLAFAVKVWGGQARLDQCPSIASRDASVLAVAGNN
jgi:ArsR family metal-binding transcriptional regulator